MRSPSRADRPGRKPPAGPAHRGTAQGGLLAALVACGPAACASPHATPLDAPAVGASTVAVHPAVDFDFDSIDDRPVSSAATRGKITVLVFVTTGSLMAQAQVDYLVAMAGRDGGAVNYLLVAVETRDNRELVDLYRKTLKVSFPVAVVEPASATAAGGFGDVTAVPVTVVLDRAGRPVLRTEARVAKSEEIRQAMRGL
ncbi:MAG: TlpA family protein disulfide reductase [Polyangiaceae bacterium]